MNNDFSIENFQAILFDFDGVLCECMHVKTEAFVQLFEEFDEEIVKKVVNHHIKHGGISRYKKIEHYYSEFLNEKISEEKLNKIAQKFSDLVVKKVIESEYVKGAKEFLEKYFKKIDMYVISGTPEDELKKIVKSRKMEKYFKGVYGSPITKPEHINKIIDENNYQNSKVLYIGDSYSDYKAAKTADIPFLGRTIKNTKSYFPNKINTIKDFNDIL